MEISLPKLMENRTMFIEQQKETEKPKPKVLFSLQKKKKKKSPTGIYEVC